MVEDIINPLEVNNIFSRLEREAQTVLTRDGLDISNHRYIREADMRYFGQSTEVRVTAPDYDFDHNSVNELIETFHVAHERIFGYAYRNTQKVELVNFSVSGFGVIEQPNLPQLKPKNIDDKIVPLETRPVYFDGKFTETPIFNRTQLLAGQIIRGPSVIEEFGSTTVIFPGQEATVDKTGIIIIRRSKVI